MDERMLLSGPAECLFLASCTTFMSFSNAKIIYTMITSFNVNRMSLDRAL